MLVSEQLVSPVRSATGTARPPAAERADRTVELQARDFLAKLGRAVQRASIYPVGHPAVSMGIGAVVTALQPLLTQGSVSVGVGRTRILLAAGASPPTEHQSPWLAARLFERGVSSLALDGDLDAQEASRLVEWVARPTDGPDDGFPSVSGVQLTRFDVGRVRFREDIATEPSSTPEATAAWRALTGALLPPGEEGAPGDDSPQVVASRVRQVLASAEGTGVTALADRLVATRNHLDAISAEAREPVLKKLALLVTELLPELRSTLLAVTSEDAPDKIVLLLDLLEHLPMSVIREIVNGLEVDSMQMPEGFSRFFEKLGQMAADDPELTAALGSHDGELGHVREATADVPQRLPRALPATLAEDASRDYVPDAYRSQLEQLATAPVRTPCDLPGLAASVDETLLEHTVARIALLEAGRGLGSQEILPYLRWIAGFVPGELNRGGLAVLAEIADLVLRANSAGLVDRESLDVLGRLRECYGRPEASELASRSFGEPSAGQVREATMVLAAGGLAAYRNTVSWIRTASPPRPARERIAAALLSLGAEVQAAIIAEVNTDRLLGESVVAVLADVEPAQAIAIATQLTSNPDADIREHATAFLFKTPLTSSKFARIVGRALEDEAPRIISLGLDAAASRPGPAVTTALAALISRPASPLLLPLQARAVSHLADGGTEPIAQLERLLDSRKLDCSLHARRLSMTIVRALSRLGDAGGRSAARRWRLSPAGLLSLLLRTRALP